MLYSFAAVVSSATIGAAMSLAGRKTMKFPLRKPKPLENYDNFPGKALPILKGQYARAMWHITRANVYTLCAFLLLQPLYSSMGDNALTVGLYRDTRTQGVLKEMKANRDPNRAFEINRIGSNVEMGSKADRGQVFSQTAAQREKLEGQRGKAIYEDPDPQGYYNDSSDGPPNDYSGGRSYETSPGSGDLDGATDTGMLTDRQMAVREARQSNSASGTFTGVPAYQRGVQQKSQQQQQQQQAAYEREQESAADDFIFDDASPSGGRGMMEDFSSSQNQPVTKSGMGGAWSRVRRGEKTAHAVSKPDDQKYSKSSKNPASSSSRGVQSSADSFSFSKSEEERQLAKEQAQRDFDRMVEGERKGVGGSEGAGASAGGSAWGGRTSGRGGL